MSYFSHGKVMFRPVDKADLDEIRRLRNDSTTWVHLTDPRPLSEADQTAWLGSLTLKSGKFYFVASDQTHSFIGLIRMDEYDPIHRSIRVGADVRPDLRGQGYGIAIYEAIKKYCFGTLGLHRVWLEVLDTNGHAKRLYEKQGFQVEGRLRDAVFRDGKYVDYVVMSILEAEYRMAPKVCTIVLSYNRPKMLLCALRSIQGADEVILLDDGSDFNVEEAVSAELARFPKASIKAASRMSVQERLSVPRVGRNINAAIRETDAEVITYLCDDDLFHEDWLTHVRSFFRETPDHVVRAKWGVFNNWDKPGDEICPIGPSFDMTTGSFAHRKSCSVDHGLWWAEHTTAVHDAVFVGEVLLPRHPLKDMKKLDVLAGWRRNHPYNMMNYTSGPVHFSQQAAEVFSRKCME